jgi:surfactin synthase thioesterase subunit
MSKQQGAYDTMTASTDAFVKVGSGDSWQDDAIGGIERSASEQDNVEGRWFRRPQGRSSSMRLFCFPYAGGSARMFREWHDWFQPGIEVVAVELPGRGAHSQSPLIDRMDVMIQRLLPAITPLLDRPFALFGHSMGAVIAFELCRALQATGRRVPLHLFASGMHPPHVKGQYRIHNLPDRQLVEALRALNGTPEEVIGDSSLVQFFLPLLRADLRLVETYRYTPGARLEHPITVFSGVGDFTTPTEQQHDWQRHTRSRCTVRFLEGNHFFIQEHAHLVAASILRSLGPISWPAEILTVEDSENLPMKEQEAEPVFSGAD